MNILTTRTKTITLGLIGLALIATIGFFVMSSTSASAHDPETDTNICQWAQQNGLCPAPVADPAPAAPVDSVVDAPPAEDVATSVDSSVTPVDTTAAKPKTSAHVLETIELDPVCTVVAVDMNTMVEGSSELLMNGDVVQEVSDSANKSDTINVEVCYAGRVRAEGNISVTIN